MPASRPALTGRAAVLILVLAALVVTLAIPLRAWFAQRAEIAALEADVSAARDRVAGLEAELEDWDDPAFVIAQARSRLHFVFPGEVGYVVLGEDDRPVVPSEIVDADESPWYSRLWESTLQADRP